MPTSRAMAHMDAASSRAMAVATTVDFLPLRESVRNRLQRRTWAFQAISRAGRGAGRPAARRGGFQPGASSGGALCAALNEARVVLRRSAVKCLRIYASPDGESHFDRPYVLPRETRGPALVAEVSAAEPDAASSFELARAEQPHPQTAQVQSPKTLRHTSGNQRPRRRGRREVFESLPHSSATSPTGSRFAPRHRSPRRLLVMQILAHSKQANPSCKRIRF